MGLLTRVLESVGLKHTEGEYREGPYFLPESGGWLPAGSAWNFWQLGHDVQTGWGQSAMVEACVSAYAQTLAMCPGNHWQWSEEKGRKRIVTSALTRFLRKPNAYQSISDFLLNATRDLLKNGNTYALALRNDRFEIVEMHLMDPDTSAPQIATDGSVFYNLSGNEVIDRMIGSKLVVPARDVLHIRMHTPQNPLIGESPLVAAALQMAAGNAALRQQVQFYSNMSRPSYVLSTDQVLTQEQATQLRQRWQEQSRGMNQGGVPILTAGLKAQAIATTAEENELVELLKLSDQAIASVFRIPLQVLGIGSTPYASTEALMQSWRAGGLGFILNHVEEAFGILFKLFGQPDEYLEFDTSALLRSAFKDRVEAWAAGVKGGVFARNEARMDFEFKPVEGGDEPWVQQQDIPLSVATENAKNPPEPPPEPQPMPDANEVAEAAAKLIMPDLRAGLEMIAERIKEPPLQLTAEDVRSVVADEVQKSIPPPVEIEPVPEESDEDRGSRIEAFAGMALVKAFAESPITIELPDVQAPRPAPVFRQVPQPHTINVRMPQLSVNPAPVNVTAEIKGGKVVKTVHRDDQGLIESWTEETD